MGPWSHRTLFQLVPAHFPHPLPKPLHGGTVLCMVAARPSREASESVAVFASQVPRPHGPWVTSAVVQGGVGGGIKGGSRNGLVHRGGVLLKKGWRRAKPWH